MEKGVTISNKFGANADDKAGGSLCISSKKTPCENQTLLAERISSNISLFNMFAMFKFNLRH